MTTREVWRPVLGHEGRYEVSNLGRIYSSKFWIVLRPQFGKYLTVSLGHGTAASVRRRTIHSVVMEAFVGPRPDGMEVNHKDGDKYNCALSNLEYVTRRDNALHRIHVLNHKCPQGERNGQAKLTNKQVLAIARKLARGPRGIGVALSREYNISQQTISRIRRGEHSAQSALRGHTKTSRR